MFGIGSMVARPPGHIKVGNAPDCEAACHRAYTPAMPQEQFDAYARSYDTALRQGLRLTGEGPEYYAQQRVRWLARRCTRLGHSVTSVLDFGCGTGTGAPFLLREFANARIVGLDISSESIERARAQHIDPRLSFVTALQAEDRFDLVHCNGVFHHIPPADRAGVLASITSHLRPGGLFALWENNPWNPGTRLVMSRIEFDRDAITLSPTYARRLLRDHGLTPLFCDHLFFFPAALGFARRLEPTLCKIPLGGQYLVLAKWE